MTYSFADVKAAVSLDDYANAFLTPRGKEGSGNYNCPKCGSGTGKNGSPACYVYTDRMTGERRINCFSCDFAGDVFDLAGVIHGTEDKREQLQLVADWAGIVLEDNQAPRRPMQAPKPKLQPVKDYSQGIAEERAKVEAWRANIEDPAAVEYLGKRGITLDMAKEWGLGYDMQRRCVVIPYPGSDYYHIDRMIWTDEQGEKYRKPSGDRVGSQPVWNLEAVRGSDPIWIVEGAFDAIALGTLGISATALTGSDHRAASEELARNASGRTVYIALDNDATGTSKAAGIAGELRKVGAEIRFADWGEIGDGAKDAAEAFEKMGSETLRAAVTAFIAKSDHEHAKERKRAREAALEAFNVRSASDIASAVCVGENLNEPIPTGFVELDSYLGGGLYPGLYVIGAGSSMGKTTLALQIADTIAASGREVLFVTIEQSAEELVSKSISRIANASQRRVIKAQEITSALARRKWSSGDLVALQNATTEYVQTIGEHMRITEGTAQPTLSSVREAALMVAEGSELPPVVFIDYLQLMASDDERDTDKKTADKSIKGLRQLARDLKTPIFAISSLNRDSYSSPIKFESFKESGGIEYGSDVLLGLQPQGIGEAVDAVKEASRKTVGNSFVEKAKKPVVRDMEIVILKNRHGRITGTGDGIKLKYHTEANHFYTR